MKLKSPSSFRNYWQSQLALNIQMYQEMGILKWITAFIITDRWKMTCSTVDRDSYSRWLRSRHVIGSVDEQQDTNSIHRTGTTRCEVVVRIVVETETSYPHVPFPLSKSIKKNGENSFSELFILSYAKAYGIGLGGQVLISIALSLTTIAHELIEVVFGQFTRKVISI